MTTPARATPMWKRILRLTLLAATTFAAVLLLEEGWDELRSSGEIGAPVLIAVTLAQIGYFLSQSERLRLIVSQHSMKKVGGLLWLRIFMVGRLLNSLLMQSGNAYRVVALRSHYGVAPGQYASSLAAQTWLSVLATLAIATLLSLAESPFGVGARQTTTLASMTAAVAAVPFLARLITSLSIRTFANSRFLKGLGGVIDRVIETTRSRRLAARIFIYIAIGFVAGAAILKLSYASAGAELSWPLAAAMLATLQLTNLVVITPGNLGVQELGFAGLSQLLGYPPATGVWASGVVRASGLVALVVATGLTEAAFRLRQRSSRGVSGATDTAGSRTSP